MNILVAIDSFKGSMTSEVANQHVQDAFCDHNVITFPIADGGEGTVLAFTQLLTGELITETITGPTGELIDASYGWVEKDKLAIIEVAEGAGITKVDPSLLDPRHHTSYGVGEQIIAALNKGAQEIIIGLGGSATVDGGMGLLQALGVKFFDQQGMEMTMLPVRLADIGRIDQVNIDPRVNSVKLTIASDVSNPLLGSNGACYVFGPQKGLAIEQLNSYEAGMRHFAQLVNTVTGIAMQNEPGAGAAGGIGFALYAFLNTSFQSGFSLLADKGELASLIKQVDLVITGEGKFDQQSLSGKVPIGISRLAKAYDKPTIVFTGKADNGLTALPEENILAVIPIVDEAIPLTEAIKNGPQLLKRAADRTLRLIMCGISLNKY
ncbi:glycerate kinase [Amphibacillus marinus]|uniref:Glycerate kinase n=1 Tax=Amphibacillus marinus TaxID=872970 RepID=A0A1H8IRC7_9BACI|nr:glycerate kinase [Amphibacillus marinus]SEN71114.1 glycerate kinase [Amphibacillus marinus]